MHIDAQYKLRWSRQRVVLPLGSAHCHNENVDSDARISGVRSARRLAHRCCALGANVSYAQHQLERQRGVCSRSEAFGCSWRVRRSVEEHDGDASALSGLLLDLLSERHHLRDHQPADHFLRDELRGPVGSGPLPFSQLHHTFFSCF